MNPLPTLAQRAHAQIPRAGVLLVNLGTPTAATPSAIRRYLAEFLSDPRVVEIPRALWLPILYSFILPFRPKRLAHAYGQIWTAEGSPLMVISRRQADGLRQRLQQRLGGDVQVELAMTYGDPGIRHGLEALAARGVRRVLLLPLYPQYSGSTTGAVMDAVFRYLRGQRWLPELRSVNSYHDDAGYIAALATSLERHWAAQGRGDHLLMSFHGVPRRYVESGDPYYCHCQKTARLLAERLGLAADRWSVSFQSRFGRAPWVQPYTDERLRALAAGGTRRLDVLCPGFAADCLETLEEVSLRYKADFLGAGGEVFRYIPALNDDDAHLEALAALAARQLDGWLPAAETPDDLAHRQARATQQHDAFLGR